MSQSKHTPGPWLVEENVKAGGIVHLAVTARHAGRDWMPCSITPMEWVRDVDRANARLIASSPLLVKTLEDVHGVIYEALNGRGGKLALSRALIDICNALAAAKGEA